MDYLDFEITIAATATGGYALTATCGDERATGDFTFTQDDTLLENHLLKIQQAVLVRSAQVRLHLKEAEQDLQTFGRTLFDALFTTPIRDLYRATRQRAATEGKRGVRLKLDIQEPRLAALPWEYLYHPGDQEYIGLSLHSPIIRTYPVTTAAPLILPRPLRILGMIANPYDQLPLDVKGEKQRLEAALAPLRNQVKLEWVANGTLAALQEALDEGEWHIFHYIGHGGFDRSRDEGFLALEDGDGRTKPAYATQLYRLFQRGQGLQLAVLNSCDSARHSRKDLISAPAIALVRRGLPAVLAMQFAIPDSVAMALTGHFYRALAKGRSLDVALSDARQSLTFDDVDALEWGVPVLYMRAGPSHSPTPLPAAPIPISTAPTAIESPLSSPVTPKTPLRPRSINLWQSLLAEAEQEEWDKAIETGEILLERNYKVAEVRRSVADAYFERSSVFFNQLTEGIDDFGFAVVLTRIEALHRDLETHIIGISRAIELFPKEAICYSLRGVLKGFATLSQPSGDFTAAYADFETAAMLEPAEAAAESASRGMLHFLALSINHPAGDVVQAIENYSNAIEKDPNVSEHYFIRGNCYFIAVQRQHPLGDYSKAIADFTHALELEPDNSAYLFERGKTYHNAANAQHKIGSYAKAIKDFTSAITIEPTNHTFVDARGITYREAAAHKTAIGNLEKALNDHNRTIELQPDNGWHYYSRGLTLQMMGKRSQANRDFAKAKALGYAPD